MTPLNHRFRDLSLDSESSKAKSKPNVLSVLKNCKESSKGYELELTAAGVQYTEESQKTRNRIEGGKALVENDARRDDARKKRLTQEYDQDLLVLDLTDREAKETLEQPKLRLFKKYGLKTRIKNLRELTDSVMLQSQKAQEKTLRDIQGDGKFVLYPSQRTAESGLGKGRVDSLQRTSHPERRDSYIAASPTTVSFTLMGTVYKGDYVLYDEQKSYRMDHVAVKTVTVGDYEPGFTDITQVSQRITREYELWRTLSQQDHPNILPFWGDFRRGSDWEQANSISDGKIYLVSPWASGGDAKRFLEQGDNRALHAFKLVGDVVLGLSFLHGEECYLTAEEKKRVWHGDLHPRNILIHEPQGPGKPLAWVADFGLSADEEATTFVTHSNYRAPELRDYDPDYRPVDQLGPDEKAAYKEERRIRASKMEKADVYSFGWTILYMLTGNYAPSSTIEESRQDDLSYILSKGQVSSGLRSLIGRCCQPDPSTRPTMAEVRDECERENLVPLEEEANREAILRD